MAFKLVPLLFTLLVCGVSLSGVNAQSLCDKYTTALTGNNTAANQYTVVNLLVNTVVIGNYSSLGTKNAVPGILAAGTFGGQRVNLLPYFDGSIPTTNFGGTSGQAVNWLDGGGAAPLRQNQPANSTNALQYNLMTHLYQYFGKLLGCSGYNSTAFPAYQGAPSMYDVHKFMNLTYSDVTYFIQQVGLSASSFGVSEADITTIATALNTTFNMRCLPAQAVVTTDPQLQSICSNPTCPLAPNANCAAYTAASTTSSPSTAAPTPAASTSAPTGAPTAAPTAAAGSTVTVTIPSGASTRGMGAFSPNPVNVKVGDTVVWMNTDSAAHTVTSNSGNELSSGNVAAGASYTHKFTASGTYTYKCNYHPGMGPGSVVVT